MESRLEGEASPKGFPVYDIRARTNPNARRRQGGSKHPCPTEPGAGHLAGITLLKGSASIALAEGVILRLIEEGKTTPCCPMEAQASPSC